MGAAVAVVVVGAANASRCCQSGARLGSGGATVASLRDLERQTG